MFVRPATPSSGGRNRPCPKRAGPPTWAAPLAVRRSVGELAQEALERPGAAHVAQARERLLLDLPHALARDAEERPDLLERHRLLAVEPEVEAEDLRLALLQPRQRLLDRLGERLLEGLLVGRRVDVVGEVVEELVVLARGERRVEREVGLRDGHGLRD